MASSVAPTSSRPRPTSGADLARDVPANPTQRIAAHLELTSGLPAKWRLRLLLKEYPDLTTLAMEQATLALLKRIGFDETVVAMLALDEKTLLGFVDKPPETNVELPHRFNRDKLGAKEVDRRHDRYKSEKQRLLKEEVERFVSRVYLDLRRQELGTIGNQEKRSPRAHQGGESPQGVTGSID